MEDEFKGHIDYVIIDEYIERDKKKVRQYFQLNPEVTLRHKYINGVSTYTSYGIDGEFKKQTIVDRPKSKLILDWGDDKEVQQIDYRNSRIDSVNVEINCSKILGFICNRLVVESYNDFAPSEKILTTYYYANDSYEKLFIDVNNFSTSKLLNEDIIYAEMKKLPLGIIVKNRQQTITRTAVNIKYYNNKR